MNSHCSTSGEQFIILITFALILQVRWVRTRRFCTVGAMPSVNHVARKRTLHTHTSAEFACYPRKNSKMLD